MDVIKRNGSREPVDIQKIINSVSRICEEIPEIDPYKIATKTVGGLYDGVTTTELDLLSIQTAVGFISDDPIYGNAAARLLANLIEKEVSNQEIQSFSQSIQTGYDNGLIADETYNFVMANKRKFNQSININNNSLFDYYGLKTVYDRYLLKHPITRKVIETPQYFLMRVSAGLSIEAKEAVEYYNLLSSLECLTSTPTLFNSGTRHSQMSSCYLNPSPLDDLKNIYKGYQDVALLSKFAGGIGITMSDIRSSGDLIKGTNGKSNGIIPWINTLNASIAAVNQGGKRKGSAAVYLDTHHPDLMEFLELRDNGGDHEKRAHNLNLANWISDLFMERVKNNETWSFFSPAVAPELNNLFGDDYTKRYLELEAEGKYSSQLPAKTIWTRMMKTISETGNGWICFKDSANNRCNYATNGRVVKLSNLCTEILEPVSSGKYVTLTANQLSKLKPEDNVNVIQRNDDGTFTAIEGGEVAVCNLASIALGRYVDLEKMAFNFAKLRKNVALAVKYLDRVIDRNFYPIHEARASNLRWRPVGLGVMGLQDVFFKLKMPFDTEEAVALSGRIQEEIYFTALKTSCELAKKLGKHRDFDQTHAAKGLLQFDLAGKADKITDPKRWNDLKEEIKEHGLRNALLIAIAPTVTIAAISGSYECIEPQVSNLFKSETLSGEFVRVNKYLVEDLKKINLWNNDIRQKIKTGDGSIQHIQEIPTELRNLYKTAWELSQKWLINHAVTRGIFIDQSQSLNLFMEDPKISKLSSMYAYAHEAGLKTTYYLRSRPATEIKKTTLIDSPVATPAINLENPDHCESCT